MKKYLKWIDDSLLPCLNCGSLWSGNAGLCQSCLRALDQLRCPSLRVGLKSLYVWSPGDSDLLSRLVTGLKGRNQLKRWDFFAAEFLRQYFPENMYRRLYLVPAPSRDDREDHAALFAKALAQRLGAVYFPCLLKEHTRSQRSAGRGERFLLELKLDEKNTALPADWAEIQWIFVDDIITTGSTAYAARKALGNPPHFEIWVLAERSLSCGASGDLL